MSSITEIIAALTPILLGMWNIYQHYQIKGLQDNYNALCDGCQYTYTPKDILKKKEEEPTKVVG